MPSRVEPSHDSSDRDWLPQRAAVRTHAFARQGVRLVLLDLDAAGPAAEVRVELLDMFSDLEVETFKAT